MIWSKLKKALTENFSDNLKSQIDFFMTDYANSFSQGRAWITIEGKEVVNFSTAEAYNHFGKPWNELTKDDRWARHKKVDDENRTEGLLIEKGEFSRGDFTDCCYHYLDLNIKDAQLSHHPIIRMLAAVDKRTGKRKLIEWIETEKNPLVKYFISYRMQKEEIISGL